MALKMMRDNLKYLSWILWLVILVFVGLIFFEWGGVNQMGGPGPDSYAARVGGEEITYEELERQYRSLEERYRQLLGANFNPDMLEQLNLPVQALNSLINEKILLLEARRLGLRASDGDVRRAILEQPVFQDENGAFIGEQEYVELLRRNRLSVDTFERDIRNQVLLDKLRSVLAETLYVTDEEVEAAYREQVERAKIRYLELPARQLAGAVEVTQADLERYYEEHREELLRPEQRRVSYLLADTVELRQSIDIPQEELQRYYEEQREEFTQEEQVRARHILIQIKPDRPREEAESLAREVRARIEAGEDFATLARELSEDEASAPRGGNLNYFGRGAMVEPFENAAFDAQVGEIVGPVETDYGFHVIEVLDHRQGGLRALEEVTPLIRSRLVGEEAAQLAEARAREVAQRLAEGKPADAEGWKQLAEEMSVKLETTAPFGRTDVIPGIGRGTEFAAAAFELAEGEVSEPIKVPRGWAVVRLEEVLAPRQPELAEVEGEVRQAVTEEKQKQAAVERLAEARAELDAGKSLEEVAGELEVEVKESAELGRGDSLPGIGPSPEVVDAALGLGVGAVAGPFEVAQGALLFEVAERKTFDPETFADERESTRSAEESERLNQLLSSLIEVRRRDLSPNYHPDVLERFDIAPQALEG